MRLIRFFLALASLHGLAVAQIAPPQLNLSGNIGCQGFPCLNSGTLIFSTDANHTMTAQESSATGGIKITSSVSLTATRNLVLPTAYGKLQFLSMENATTGGQSIIVIGQGGTGITIPNGQSATGVWFDGTNVTGTLPGGGGVSSFNTRTGAVTLTAADVDAVGTVSNNTSGNAATATALATTPSLCSTGNAPTGVLANGNATGCAAIGGGGLTPLQLRTAIPVSGTVEFGDSTVACDLGASVPQTCFAAQLQNDVPGTWLADYALGGTATNQIAQQAWAKWNPVNSVFQNPLVIYEGGINDANTTGATTGSENNATLATIAGAAHVAIPFANQTMASAAASSTGTWVASSFGLGQAAAVSGTPMSSTTNGSTRTYSLGALAKGVYVWGAADSNGGTFTVSVNGTLQTNLCTGTTTFDSFGCNSQTFGFGGGSVLGQVFSNSNTGCDCLVVTVTSSTSGSNVVYDGAVMMVPTGLAASVLAGTAPLVGIQGVLRQYTDTDSSATAALNTAVLAGYTALSGAGLANVYFADVRNGVTAGSGYPAAAAINTTTDYTGGAGCAGGNVPLHPGDCGYFHIARLHESAAAAAGFPVFNQNSGSRSRLQPSGQSYQPTNIPGDYSNDFEFNPQSWYSSTAPMPGICMYGFRSSCLARRFAFEYSSSFNQYGTPYGLMLGDPAGIGCDFANPTSGNLCGSVWNSPTSGAYHFWTQHFGAGTPNGNVLQPAVGTVNAISIDSQQTGGSSIPGSVGATIVYMQSTTTAVELKACQPTSGVYGSNWLTWYVVDSATALSSLVFNHSSDGGNTDTINGASSVTYTAVPPNTVFQAQCSQGTATTSNITISVLSPTIGSGAFVPLAGGTMTGPLTINSATTPGIAVNDTSSASGFQALGSFLQPSAPNGNHILFWTGTAFSTNDTAYFSILHNGAGSSTNVISLGFFGADDLFQIFPSGNTQLKSGAVAEWNGDTGLSRDSAGVVDCGNGTAGNKSCTFNAANIAPLYSTSGTLQSNAHQVIGSGTATGTALVVTLSGSAIFTGSSTYACMVDDQAALPVTITYTSGSSFTITDDGTGDVMRYVCTGN